MANLLLARMVPARSSGVRVGRNFSSCSTVVILFLSCHFESFQRSSGIVFQHPRPDDLNSFSFRSLPSMMDSSIPPTEALFILAELYFGFGQCQDGHPDSGISPLRLFRFGLAGV